MPKDVLEYFGNFRWWDQPNCLSHPECARLVPDLSAAITELRDLYDEATCRKLVAEGCGARVFPLFMQGWFINSVDDLLQLGCDLIEYPNWRNRAKLVGELRSSHGWPGARFEVGVQAGLRRVGLIPEVEPATAKDATRPDFVVRAGAIQVGLELKGISDPDYARNRDRLCSMLAERMFNRQGRTQRCDITLRLSDEMRARLRSQYDLFISKFLPVLGRELDEVLSAALPNTQVAMTSVGDLVISYPPWNSGCNYLGSYSVIPDEIDGAQLLSRALARASVCSKQLAAVNADLRVAVLWGSRSLLPADGAAIAAQQEIEDGYSERWAGVSLDWIVFFNTPTLSLSHEWSTDLGLCRLPHARHDIPQSILDGIKSWGRWRGR